jgi:serine/threonine-protein kinase RsbW
MNCEKLNKSHCSILPVSRPYLLSPFAGDIVSFMHPLIVPGKIDSLSKIAQYVIVAAAEAELDKKASYGLYLAVDEIAINIIMHGYQESGREGDLELRAEISDRNLTIMIEDTAVTYDPFDRALTDDSDKHPHEKKIGGFGVYLAMQNVDEFAYEWLENRNRNIFTVHRTSHS